MRDCVHARIGHLPAREVSPGDIVDIGELTRAERKRVNFERKEWTIPPEHSKNKKQFVIPLTGQVTGWFIDLRRLAFDSRFVLPLRHRRRGREDDAPMEATSLNAALDRFEVRHYLTGAGADPFAAWLAAMRDRQAQARVQTRIDRLERGLLGDAEPYDEGVWGLRIDWRPGYRVYCARSGERIIRLLLGGDKRKAAGRYQACKGVLA